MSTPFHSRHTTYTSLSPGLTGTFGTSSNQNCYGVTQSTNICGDSNVCANSLGQCGQHNSFTPQCSCSASCGPCCSLTVCTASNQYQAGGACSSSSSGSPPSCPANYVQIVAPSSSVYYQSVVYTVRNDQGQNSQAQSYVNNIRFCQRLPLPFAILTRPHYNL